MLIFYLICCAPVLKFFHLLCSILCSCKDLAVLLEYIHLHHKNFNVITFYQRISKVLHTTVAQIIIIVDVLLEYIDLN